MRTIRLKYVMLSLLFITAGSFAQTKKLSKNYKTSQDVNVELDSRHTNIIIENWDKNEVQIEAYLEGDTGDREMTEKLLNSWKLETSNSNGRVKINSGGSSNWTMDMGEIDLAMSHLQPALEELPDMLGPLMENLDKEAYRDPKFDTLVLERPVEEIDTSLEQFTILFEQNGEFVNLILAWDNTSVSIPIKQEEAPVGTSYIQ